VRVYDRPLLRSSARGDGALKASNDRFAIGFASLQASVIFLAYATLQRYD